jgi:hypothetical protein
VFLYKKVKQHITLVVFIFLISIVSFCNIALSGYYSLYYTFHLILPCLLLILMLIKWIEDAPINAYYKAIMLGLIILPMAARRATINDTYKAFKKNAWHTTTYNEFYKDFKVAIDTLAEKPNSLFVLNNAPALSLANAKGIKVHTKWILNYFWNEASYMYTKFDSSGVVFKQEVLMPLRNKKPAFVICLKEHERNPHKLRKDIRYIWQQFVDSHYVHYKTLPSDTEIVMYRLKP